MELSYALLAASTCTLVVLVRAILFRARLGRATSAWRQGDGH